MIEPFPSSVICLPTPCRTPPPSPPPPPPATMPTPRPPAPPRPTPVRRAGSKLFFDTHLMLAEPQKYIEPFAKAGSNNISIHIEPGYDHRGTLARIRQLGCQCGIVLNPGTPAASIETLVGEVDLVLVMTVQ